MSDVVIKDASGTTVARYKPQPPRNAHAVLGAKFGGVGSLRDPEGYEVFSESDVLVPGTTYAYVPPLAPPERRLLEVKPVGLYEDVLFQRERAALAIANALLARQGRLTTPVMDQAFGAGKTTVAYRFREVLADMERTDRARLFNGNAESPGSVEETVARVLSQALTMALGQSVAPSSAAEVVSILEQHARGSHFIFIFDEVGSFEKCRAKKCIEDGVRALYDVWHFSETLDAAGHFSILLGRSQYLYLIGHNVDFPGKPCDGTSINETVLIPVDLMTRATIADMLRHFGLAAWCTDVSLDLLVEFTAGAPRLLDTLIGVFKGNNIEPPHSREAGVRLFLSHMVLSVMQLKQSFVLPAPASESEPVRVLLDLVWSEIAVSRASTMVDGRNISDVIAWAGVFADPFGEGDLLTVRMSRYFKSERFAGCLANLSECATPGERLENAVLSVIRLRLKITPRIDSFSDLGLPGLDALPEDWGGLALPERLRVSDSPLPKFSKGGCKDADELAAFMQAAESSASSFKTVFHPALLGRMYAMLVANPGLLYYFLPQSGTADALFALPGNTIVCLQFKNLISPFNVADLSAEAEKCAAADFRVFLVVICTAGHTDVPMDEVCTSLLPISVH
eukprot:m51a1_g3944 hypothetical protein (624) ;mRNA; r:298428-300848